MARFFKSSFTGILSTFNLIGAIGVILFIPMSMAAQTPQTNLAVTVRHAPSLNGNGLIEGSLQQLLGEDVTLNGGFVITGDLLEPGTPTLRVNGHPTIAGTVPGSGSASPGGYSVLLNGNCSLNYLRTRTSPVSLPVVPLPPQPAGTRNVIINNPGQSIGDAATLRNLTLNGNIGPVAIPPGTYGAFTANGGCAFTLGVAGATQPAIYNLQSLNLNGQSRLEIVGPVILTVAGGFTANGMVGTTNHSSWLQLQIASGGFTLNGGCTVHGSVSAPAGTVTVNGNSCLIGSAQCDRLIVNGGGRIKAGATPNQAPVADAQNLSVAEDTPLTVTLTGSDPEGAPLTCIVLSQPSHGTLNPQPSTLDLFTYLPTTNFNGADSFTFKVNDGQADSAAATISIVVTPVNDPPAALSQKLSTPEDTALDITLAGADVENDPLTFQVVTPPAHGTLNPQPSTLNLYTYLPAPHYNGVDSFTFRANDGEAWSAPATLSITVQPVNDAPVASSQTVTTDEDTSVPIVLTALDVDGDGLTFSILTQPAHGTLNPCAFASGYGATSNQFIYLPATDYNGSDSFTFKADDGFLDSDPATVRLIIRPVNDAPVATTQTVTLLEDTATNIVLAATDVDGDALTYKIATPAAHGTLHGTPPQLIYSPSADCNGVDSFTFTVNDGQTDSAPATVSLIIAPVNDPPQLTVPGAQTIAENETLLFDISRLLTISDADAGAGMLQLSLSVSNGPVALGSMNGLTCIAGANGSTHLVVRGSLDDLNAALLNLTYLGSTNYSGTDDFTLAVDDLGNTGIGGNLTDVKTIAITVTRINVAPTISITTPAAQSEFAPGQPIPVNIDASDSDGQVTRVRIFADDTLLAELTVPPYYIAWTDGAPGSHVLSATATDDSGAISTASNIVVSVVQSESGGFVVDAGPDQIISLPDLASLAGTVEIQSVVTGSGTSAAWSKAGGPGVVQFSNPESIATAAQFSEPGTYTLRLRANYGEGTRSDTLTVDVLPSVPNRLKAARSNRGSDFWLTFLPNESGSSEPNHSGTDLFISADVDTEGKVTFIYGKYNGPTETRFHIVAGSTTRITAGSPDLEASDFIEANAVHVTADHPVTVYGLDYTDYSTDGYLALPTSMLGTNYFVLSYRNTPAFYDTNVVMGGTTFVVVAPEADTHVTITPTANAGSRVAGVPYQITLQNGETYRLMNSDDPVADFSGTTITSDNPVAVFAGNKITTIPPITPAGDHLVEQLPPVNMWGRHFVTMPLATRAHGDTFRFLAQTNGTRVAVNGTIVATLDRGQYHEQMIDGPAQILSSQPIMVAQYANSTDYDGSTGDPFMMIIPPFEQFGGEYIISTPLHFWCYDNYYYYSDIYTNYLNLVVRTDGIGLIQLDGVAIPASDYQLITNTSYAGAQLPIVPGPHHLSAPFPFGVCIYGWAYCESYAFMGGVYSETVDLGTQLKLIQSTASAAIGTEKVVTARVEDRHGRPLADIGVDFSVSGAHIVSGHIATSLSGEATFAYIGTNAGVDVITATLVDLEEAVTNTWIPATDNAPPVVSTAGTQPLQFGLTAQLAGTAGDDGNPSGSTLNLHWRLLNGPADVLFENAAQLRTHASCAEPGIYKFELTADDSQFSSRSVVTVRMDVLPTIQFPLSDLPAIVGVGSNVLVTADAEDFDGSIDRVEFYCNDILIGTSTNSDWWNGYNVIWTPVTNGTCQLRAVSVDNFGGTQSSETVTVAVTFPPRIEVTLPDHDLIFPFGASIATFKARASDPDGSVTNFAVYYVAGDAGPMLIYQVAGDQIDHTGLVDPTGICYNYSTPHPLLFVATDDHGISTAIYSANITFLPPVVTADIVSPVEGQVFHVGQPIDFLVEGSVTPPARITSVGFFQGVRTWWGFLNWYWLDWPADDSPPYTTRWIPSNTGDYEFSALVETDADPCNGFRTTTRHIHVIPASIGASITAPANSASLFTGHAWPISIALDDPAGIFDYAEFFANGISLGQTTNLTLMWLPSQADDYTLAAIVYDHSGQSYDAGNTVTVHVGPPPNPVISLSTIPDGETNRLAGVPMLLVAAVSAANPEQIVKVEFFEDGRSEGQVTNRPYVLAYVSTNPGPHTLTARATTDFGTTADSSPINILCTPSLGVAWEQVRSGEWTPVGINKTLGVRLDDPGHIFDHVEFLANDAVLTSTIFMFYDWRPSAPGDYRLRARAYDRFGNDYDSAEIVLHTAVLHKPQVSFVSPSPLARFAPGQPVNFVVQATDAESTVTNISLYLYSQPQVSSPDNPMSYAWTNLAPGERQFTAIATDDKGLTGSARVRIIVDLPVSAELLPPQNLTAQVLGSSAIQISWDTNSGVATNPVVVERAEGTNEIWRAVKKVDLEQGKTMDLFLNAATTYRYRAYVQSADGFRSVNSDVLVARTRPYVAGYAVLDLAENLEDAAALKVAVNEFINGEHTRPRVSEAAPRRFQQMLESDENGFLDVFGGMESQQACDERSPSPRPSPPGEGESSSGFGRYERTQVPSRFWSDDPQRGDCNDGGQIDQRLPLALPLHGGEGRGEGGCKVSSPFPARSRVQALPSAEIVREAGSRTHWLVFGEDAKYPTVAGRGALAPRIILASYLPQQNQDPIVDMPASLALGISDFNAVLLGGINLTNYIWSPDGTFQELSDTNFLPLRMTRSGFAVGSRLSQVLDSSGSLVNQFHAGYWDNMFFDFTPDVRALREPMTLPPLAATYATLDSLADMNAGGVAAGSASWVLVYPSDDQGSGLLFGPVRRATVWPGNKQPPVNFGSLQQINNESAFNAINDAGDLVGVSALTDPNLPNAAITHAIRSQLSLADSLTDKLTDLGTLGGIYSAALSINNAGVAVGYSTVLPEDAITNSRAVCWLPAETQPRQLPGYDANLRTYAWDINKGGQIVGDAADTNGVQQAVLWKSATNGPGYDLVNLNDLVRRSDWHLASAHAINTHGFIVGSGTRLTEITVQGQASQLVMFPRAFLLVPDSSLAVDYNRDGIIELNKNDDLPNGQPYQFWVNDDSDGDFLSGKFGIGDMPGAQPDIDGRNPDCADDKVNGAADLVDWFPVYLNISNLLALLPPFQYQYRLVQADGALNFIYTDLRPEESGSYLTNALPTGFGDVFTQPAATARNVHQVTADGVVLSAEFLDKAAHEGRGVLLFEARQPTTQPLRLEVRNSRRVVTSLELPLQISGAEDMYGWVNLRYYAGGPVDRYTHLFPPNWPAFANEDEAFVFLHGYNVNERQSRAWAAEMFKRLWWSGSHRRFYGVSWFGDDTQLYSQFTINYHTNVIHAIQTAPELATFLKARSQLDITVAAHSLGNMVVCSAIQDYEARPDRYFMVDSAVAMEAFDGGLDKEPLMTHPDWSNYPERLYASEWYYLFLDTDGRHGLTWRNRFKDVSSLTELYNFYSSGEEVAKNRTVNTDPYALDLVSFQDELGNKGSPMTGENAWNLQELLKGRVTAREIANIYLELNPTTIPGALLDLAMALNGVRAGNIIGSQYGGWGFNSAWDYSGGIQQIVTEEGLYDVYVPEHRRQPEETISISAADMQTKPFFLPFFDTRLYQSDGSAAASEWTTRTRLLAEDVPARTFAAGANALIKKNSSPIPVANFDMNDAFQKRGWPTERVNSLKQSRWLHSDWHDIPYLYNGMIFDAFVELEGGR